MDRTEHVRDSVRVSPRDRKPPITVIPRRHDPDDDQVVVQMPESFFSRIVNYARNGPPPMVARPLARQAEVEREVRERLAKEERVAETKRRAAK